MTISSFSSTARHMLATRDDSGVSNGVGLLATVFLVAGVVFAVIDSGVPTALGCGMQDALSKVTQQDGSSCQSGTTSLASSAPAAPAVTDDPLQTSPPATAKEHQAGRSNRPGASNQEGGGIMPILAPASLLNPMVVAFDDSSEQDVLNVVAHNSSELLHELNGIDVRMTERDFARNPDLQTEVVQSIAMWNAIVPQMQAIATKKLDPFDDPGKSVLQELDNAAYLLKASTAKVSAATGQRIPTVTVQYPTPHTSAPFGDGNYS